MRSEPSISFGLNSESSRFVCECYGVWQQATLFRMPHGEIPERNQSILHYL
jgi:hypothetical protein